MWDLKNQNKLGKRKNKHQLIKYKNLIIIIYIWVRGRNNPRDRLIFYRKKKKIITIITSFGVIYKWLLKGLAKTQWFWRSDEEYSYRWGKIFIKNKKNLKLNFLF